MNKSDETLRRRKDLVKILSAFILEKESEILHESNLCKMLLSMILHRWFRKAIIDAEETFSTAKTPFRQLLQETANEAAKETVGKDMCC